MEAYQLYTKLASLSTSAFGFALIEILGPIAIVVGSLNLLDSRLASAFEKADAKFSKQVQEHMAEWTRASEKRLTTEEEGYTKSQRALETYLAEMRKSYFKQVDDAREVDTELIASSRQTMTQMISGALRGHCLPQCCQSGEIKPSRRQSKSRLLCKPRRPIWSSQNSKGTDRLNSNSRKNVVVV